MKSVQGFESCGQSKKLNKKVIVVLKKKHVNTVDSFFLAELNKKVIIEKLICFPDKLKEHEFRKKRINNKFSTKEAYLKFVNHILVSESKYNVNYVLEINSRENHIQVNAIRLSKPELDLSSDLDVGSSLLVNQILDLKYSRRTYSYIENNLICDAISNLRELWNVRNNIKLKIKLYGVEL